VAGAADPIFRRKCPLPIAAPIHQSCRHQFSSSMSCGASFGGKVWLTADRGWTSGRRVRLATMKRHRLLNIDSLARFRVAKALLTPATLQHWIVKGEEKNSATQCPESWPISALDDWTQGRNGQGLSQSQGGGGGGGGGYTMERPPRCCLFARWDIVNPPQLLLRIFQSRPRQCSTQYLW